MLEPCSPSLRGLRDLEMSQDDCTSKQTIESCGSRKGKVLPGSEAIGMHAGWQQLAHSKFRAPILDCSYESQEGVQVTEQLNTRVPSLDAYFGTQQVVHGMDVISSLSLNRNDYFGNQQSMQGLGQLNSTALIHNAHLLSQQRLLGLGQLHFRPQTMQGCFNMQHNLQDMDHFDVRPVLLNAMGSKQTRSKHFPH